MSMTGGSYNAADAMAGQPEAALDEPTKSLLQQMVDSGAPPLYALTVTAARDALKQLTLALDAPSCAIARCEERNIQGPAGEIPIRIYWPEVEAGELSQPVLLLYHGGGFALGDLDTHDRVSRFYCKNGGVIVVSVGYRLAPEHPFPAALTDCYAALCWVAETAAQWGGDATRIAVTGDSAGGNLAALVSQLARDRQGPHIAFQALVYPVVDMDPASEFPSRREFGGGGYFLSQNDFVWFMSLYFTAPEQERGHLASPILAKSLVGLPPALIITAGFDPLRDEGRAYYERLVAAGVAAEYRCFETTVHGFMSFAGLIIAGQEGLQLLARRLREVLRSAT
jgi:acetyl esterase